MPQVVYQKIAKRKNRSEKKISLLLDIVKINERLRKLDLSIGQSVSVTMAMERSFGEIGLADFGKFNLINSTR